jgi:hypothetical protein
MFKGIFATVVALGLAAPISSYALSRSTPNTFTGLHWIAGTGASVPTPAACGSITDIRLDVTLNSGSTFFGANGMGSCTNTSDVLILTGSGVILNGVASFNVYFGDTRMICSVYVTDFAGSCSIYLLSDFSLASTFDISFSTAP